MICLAAFNRQHQHQHQRRHQGHSSLLLWLQAAACFGEAAGAQPDNLKALGNWGNALLEHGKARSSPSSPDISFRLWA